MKKNYSSNILIFFNAVAACTIEIYKLQLGLGKK